MKLCNLYGVFTSCFILKKIIDRVKFVGKVLLVLGLTTMQSSLFLPFPHLGDVIKKTLRVLA